MKIKSVLFVFVFFIFLTGQLFAVNSKIVRHDSKVDFSKGETENVIIGSRGTIEMARAAEILSEDFEGAWSINSIVSSGSDIYIGTSPNGGLYKYSLGKLTKIYPLPTKIEAGEPNEPNDSNAVEMEQHLINEHIFAMSTDISGRLLVGISGAQCALYRLKAGEMEMVFEPNDANKTKYIFAVTTDAKGNIYLATGPKGKVYKLDPAAKNSELIYDSSDKNILSLAIGKDSFVYAGSDQRGLVYKINPDKKTAAVLYDSAQAEITALAFGQNGWLYAAATSANLSQPQAQMPSGVPPLGRPEPQQSQSEQVSNESDGGLKLEIANTSEEKKDAEQPDDGAAAIKKIGPAKASYIYQITPDGYVTDVFGESAVLFCLAVQDGKLLVGTGNNAELFAVEPDDQQEAVVYRDKKASQITAVSVADGDVYIGTANPAKLIKLGSSFANEGTYLSALVDAGQPARWGKLQIEADIPDGCKVLAASRSGNVKDINDATFSNWSVAKELTEPAELDCPVGRFCQYKLTLQSNDSSKTPTVTAVATASVVPNLAPKVISVDAARTKQKGQTGIFKISYKAKDDNGDKLIYKIDFRKVGRKNWLELEDEIEKNNFQWDSKTVEDGKYEIRITANDKMDNSPETMLTASRISEQVVVDNTAPVIEEFSIDEAADVTLKLNVFDKLSAIGQLQYTVDSNSKWLSALPDDLVYDTTNENFTIVIKDLKAGEHIISVKIADDIGNTMYKSFQID
ncbi:MAG: hypothetical protein KAQ89_01890 [Planctomycetes bacterium]|nr:hypothetical protein [Planctomycetota bacterium]